MALEPEMNAVCMNQNPYKMSSRSTKYVIYKKYWPDLLDRLKYDGGELTKGLYYKFLLDKKTNILTITVENINDINYGKPKKTKPKITIIKDELGITNKINLKNWPWIPNYDFKLIKSLLARNTDKTVDVLFSTKYDSDKNIMSMFEKKVRKIVNERTTVGKFEELGNTRIGSPIARPHQIICIGLNYADHAKESGQDIPAEPILFTKSPNTIIGPNDDVRIPRGSTKTDWEVELGIVIGKRASYLNSEAEAKECIAGWVLVNDVSEREFQIERGGQWMKGKSAETFNPTGPFLATQDEIEDVNNLEMTLDVNGVRRQTGSTATMIFNPFFIVKYISQFLVLEPGDLINTGTPPGVGLGFKPPIYLKAGDVMELSISGLGNQKQKVIGPR